VKVEEKGAAQLAEHKETKDPLKQTHQSRYEKLVQMQKEERAKYESMLAEVLKQLDEKWAKSKEDLKALEETDRQALLNPPKPHAPEGEGQENAAKEDAKDDDE